MVEPLPLADQFTRMLVELTSLSKTLAGSNGMVMPHPLFDGSAILPASSRVQIRV